MSAVEITIKVDAGRLPSCSDEYLVMLWHLAQANPAPYGDRDAGELVERIGREIIRRWLASAPVDLWHHQGRDYYWHQLRQLGSWKDGQFVADVDEPPAEDLAVVAELDVPGARA